MGVVIQNLPLASLADARKLAEELRGNEVLNRAREQGWLEEVRVQVDPEKPTHGSLLTRWAGPDEFHRFEKETGGLAEVLGGREIEKSRWGIQVEPETLAERSDSGRY